MALTAAAVSVFLLLHLVVVVENWRWIFNLIPSESMQSVTRDINTTRAAGKTPSFIPEVKSSSFSVSATGLKGQQQLCNRHDGTSRDFGRDRTGATVLVYYKLCFLLCE